METAGMRARSLRLEGLRERGMTRLLGWPNSATASLGFRLALVVFVTICMSCCGSGGSTHPSVVVNVSPASATMQVNGQARFTASVFGTTNTAVTWQVNGKKGGNSNLGTITSTGVYTAPASVPSSAVTVEAVSSENTHVSGSAKLTIQTAKTMAISPAAVTVLTGNKQQFTATVNGVASSAVYWSINGLANGNSIVGLIDPTGLYSAPATPPAGGLVEVTATLASDSTQSASASVAVRFGTEALQGQYAFLVRGQAANGPVARAGSFTADGEGNVSSGIMDVATISGTSTIRFNSGTYSVGADGRGNLSLSNPVTGTVTFLIAVSSNDRGTLVETDAEVSSAGGWFYAQNASDFTASVLSGSYVFDFSGTDTSGYPKSIIGRFTGDGGGHLTDGLLDLNDNSSNSGPTEFSSASYQMDPTYGASFGRGTASIDGLQLVFYVVDRTRNVFLEIDPPAISSGSILAQQTPPTDVSGLSGNYGFGVTGATEYSSSASGKPAARAGRFTADGSGNITDLVMLSNSAGQANTIPSSGTDSGTYTIDTSGSGRGTLTFTDRSDGTFSFVFYLVSPTEAVFQDTSKKLILDGRVLGQTTESITTSQLAGNYAFLWSGWGSGEDDFSGQLIVASASSNNAAGTIDLNEAATVASDDTVYGDLAIKGDGTALNTLSLKATDPSGNFSFKAVVIDADAFLVISSNDSLVSGICERQY